MYSCPFCTIELLVDERRTTPCVCYIYIPAFLFILFLVALKRFAGWEKNRHTFCRSLSQRGKVPNLKKRGLDLPKRVLLSSPIQHGLFVLDGELYR